MVCIVLSVLSLVTLQRAFALDALVTKQGKVIYGTVSRDHGKVVITYDGGGTEELEKDGVDVFSRIAAPTRKAVARKGNFEVIDGLAVPAPIDMNKFRSSMLLALASHRWVVDEERPGELYCRLSKVRAGGSPSVSATPRLDTGTNTWTARTWTPILRKTRSTATIHGGSRFSKGK